MLKIIYKYNYWYYINIFNIVLFSFVLKLSIRTQPYGQESYIHESKKMESDVRQNNIKEIILLLQLRHTQKKMWGME